MDLSRRQGLVRYALSQLVLLGSIALVVAVARLIPRPSSTAGEITLAIIVFAIPTAGLYAREKILLAGMENQESSINFLARTGRTLLMVLAAVALAILVAPLVNPRNSVATYVVLLSVFTVILNMRAIIRFLATLRRTI